MELTAFSDAPVLQHDAPVTYSPLLPTGVAAVDRVWGGLYRGGSYLLYGRGASGRDLITLRFAQTGAELGESCLFISTARPKDLMIQAASIGFDLREAYEQEKVKLLRVPPTLAHQGGEDVGVLRAMRDLVALIREHRPQRLVVNDFMPFVMFRSYDRLRASIVDLLEQTDVLDMTMILMMSEPGNDQSRRVVEFVASQMTGALHLEMVSDDPESTLRRLTFLPNIGHVRGRRSEPWDLTDMLKPVEVPVAAERRMLPAPPRMPEPPRYRGIRLGAPEPDTTSSTAVEGIPLGYAFKSEPAPAAPEPASSEPAMPAPPIPITGPPIPVAAVPLAPPQAPPAAPPFVWTPEPGTIYPSAHAEPETFTPETTAPARAALRPGATSLRSGSPRQAEMLPEVPTFGAPDDGFPTAAHPAPTPINPVPAPAPVPMPSHPAPPMPATAFGTPTSTPYAPYAAPVETTPHAAPAPVNPYAAPTNPYGAPAPHQAAPHQAPPQPTPAPVYEHAAAPATGYTAAPSPYAPAPAPPAPTPPLGSSVRTRAEAMHDRAAFSRLLDEQFRLRSVQGSPFLLVAMRLEPSGGRPSPFGFEFVSDLMRDALRAQDALLVDPKGERLVALLPAAQPEEAGALFTRFKSRLREEAPHQAEALLNAVSAIVLRNGEATTGEAFRNAEAVLAYMLDNG